MECTDEANFLNLCGQFSSTKFVFENLVIRVGRFVLWVVLSLGRFVPRDVLSLGPYVLGLFVLGRFVPGTFLSLGTFVLSWGVLSLGRFVLGRFVPWDVCFVLGRFVCAPTVFSVLERLLAKPLEGDLSVNRFDNNHIYNYAFFSRLILFFFCN